MIYRNDATGVEPCFQFHLTQRMQRTQRNNKQCFYPTGRFRQLQASTPLRSSRILVRVYFYCTACVMQLCRKVRESRLRCIKIYGNCAV